MSGRSLRRLPVLAHARYIGSLSTMNAVNAARGQRGKTGGGTDVGVWLEAMERVVEHQATQRGHLHQ